MTTTPAVKFAIIGDAFVDISVGAPPLPPPSRARARARNITLTKARCAVFFSARYPPNKITGSILSILEADNKKTDRIVRVLTINPFHSPLFPSLTDAPRTPPFPRPTSSLPTLFSLSLALSPPLDSTRLDRTHAARHSHAGPLDALPAPGGDVEVSTVSQGPGGSALNTAWHLAAQDVPTTLHAAVGRDRMAQVLTIALQTESKVLDAGKTLAVLEHDTTATCVSMFGPHVERTFMSTYGAAKTATVAHILGRGGADALGDDVTHVHVGGFYVCKGIHAGLPEAVKRLRARGVKVSMDPNFDAAGQWTPPAMLSVICGPSAVDVLMPSEVEACEITGKDTADEALEVLLRGGEDGAGGVGLVVIKRGAMGVLAGRVFLLFSLPSLTSPALRTRRVFSPLATIRIRIRSTTETQKA